MILAGGLGTRMRPMTDQVPKALLPVNGVPFAHHQLSWLAREGITSVVYCIGRLGHLIREFVGTGQRWGVRVRFVEDGPVLLGTAGAVRNALAEGALESSFLTIYGDSYLPIQIDPVVKAFVASGLPALMTVHRNDGAWDSSNAVFSDGLVTLYEKRADPHPAEMRYIDYGLSVFDARIFDEAVPAGESADLSAVFHGLSTARQLAGFEVTQRFYEVGSHDGLAALEEYLASR